MGPKAFFRIVRALLPSLLQLVPSTFSEVYSHIGRIRHSSLMETVSSLLQDSRESFPR